jgi:hypothetical protein
VSEYATVRRDGLDIWGNNLSFAAHGNEVVSVDGDKNRWRTSDQANVIRNSGRNCKVRKIADGGFARGGATRTM